MALRGHFLWGYLVSSGLVLLDESGDLGWVLDQPYRQGGSSRFFTIGATVGVNNAHRKPGKVFRKLASLQKWTSKNEKKWVDQGNQVRKTFANLAVEMAKANPEVQLLVCVLDKRKVPKHIQGHHHLMYSWMASSLIAPSIRSLRQASICPDELNTGSDALIETVLRKDLWFHLRSKTQITRVPRKGPLEDGLAFCDFLAGAFQSHYEDGASDAFEILKDVTYLHEPWS